MTSQKLSAFTSIVVLSSLATPAVAEPISFSATDLLVQSPQEETDPTNPDGDFLQPVDPTTPPPNDDPLFPEIDDTDPLEYDLDNGTPFPIEEINVEGSSVFTDEDFAPILEPFQGENITTGQLRQATAAITQLYLDNGYINSRAVLPEQDLSDGIATIEVQEGTISDVQITGLQRFKEHYFTSRVGLGIDTPFNINDLEDQLRLLQINPLVEDLDVDLQAGENPGSSTLLLDIAETNPFFGSAFFDNYSAASVGAERFGVNLGYRNFLGIGDVFSTTGSSSITAGALAWNLNYAIPVNPMDGTVQLTASFSRTEVTDPAFTSLGIQGSSQSYGLSFRQPLVRSFTEEFALSLGYTHNDGKTFLFENIGTPFSSGAEADGTTRTRVLSFGQDYLKRDNQGAWILRSQFNLGLDIFGATINTAPTPSGDFFSWSGQVQRLHQLADDHLLVVQGDVQFSPDNLLGGQKFSIGGGQTLRGYRQGARSGDNGWRFSIEDRITLIEEKQSIHLLQVAPFFDMGTVWNNPSNPDQITNEHFMAGVGLGIIYAPIENWVMRLDFTLPLVNLTDRSVNAQDDGIYFSLNYTF